MGGTIANSVIILIPSLVCCLARPDNDRIMVCQRVCVALVEEIKVKQQNNYKRDYAIFGDCWRAREN